MTQGMKFDTEKPRLDLLINGMPRALEEVAKVLTFGSAKYADHNWQKVEHAQTRYLAASTRHELALARGEFSDDESGLPHLAHKICCDLFRLELQMRAEETPAKGEITPVVWEPDNSGIYRKRSDTPMMN